MTRLFPLFPLLLGLALVTGCSPARSGVAGNTLSTTTKPPISITAKAPLRLMASGNLDVPIPNDIEALSTAIVSFPYAVFGDGNASGPVTRHAHAMLSKLEDSASWRFQPNTAWKPRNTMTTRQEPDGYAWTSQLLLVSSRGDWFSELWTANGRDVPKLWLAKRWSALLDEVTKAVYEYREPCADYLSEDALAFPMLDADSAARLKAFNSRAEAAFSTSARNTPLPDTAPEQILRALPEKLPNTGKLVGEALAKGSKDSPD